MSEQGWGDDFQDTVRPPGSTPRWVWTCGWGCLLGAAAIVLLIVLTWDRVIEYGTGLIDPSRQWPEVAKVLPFDEQPELEILRVPGMGFVDIDMWYFGDDEHDLIAILMAADGPNGDEILRSLLDPNHDQDVLGQPLETDELESIEVQGRSLRLVRFRANVDEAPDEAADEAADEGESAAIEEGGLKFRWGQRSNWSASGSGAMIDVGPADGSRNVVMQLMRDGSAERLGDDQIRAFLAPFRIGDD